MIQKTPEKRSDQQISGAFDFKTGRVRFEHQFLNPGSAQGPVHYIRTPEDAWFYAEPPAGSTGSPSLTRWKPDYVKKGLLFKVHDPRMFGLAGIDDFRSQGTRFEDFTKTVEEDSDNALALADEEGGQICIDYRFGRPTRLKRSVWIDAAKALIIHEELRYWNNQAGEWGRLHSSTSTEWEQRSDVWLPKVFRGKTFSQNRADDSTYSKDLEVSFTWHEVNKPLDNVLFDPIDGLKPKIGTRIVDERGEKPITLGKVGDNQ